MASTPVDKDRQMEQVRELIATHREQGWDEAWKVGTTPWDAGTPQPALRHLLESGRIDFPRSGRALVPGCGRGYDAITIAQTLGLATLGTDISPTAVEAARQNAQSTASAATVRFELTDFFKMEEEDAFSLIYDYTFFVAIPPSRRAEWGQQMRKLVKPGGYLITLIYPLLPYREFGPPFYVRPV
ncbi:S-adenosyl-L-methionine-dependent methyltransferase [Earliella scabrosa]|nr:S-adenosyl-L-methionine-dependent methyltransferase [Earliella scabrosa]